MRFMITSLVAIASSMALPTASAHSFHYQIHATSQFQADTSGKLTAITMDWDYDPQVTSIMLEGEDLSPEQQKQTLQTLSKRLMQDLAAFNYFTDLKINNETVLLNEPDKVELTVKAVDHSQHLQLHFQLPLQVATSIQGQTTVLTLADPYGTGILSYATDNSLVLPSTWHGCSLQRDATAANEKPVPNAVKLTCPANA